MSASNSRRRRRNRWPRRPRRIASVNLGDVSIAAQSASRSATVSELGGLPVNATARGSTSRTATSGDLAPSRSAARRRRSTSFGNRPATQRATLCPKFLANKKSASARHRPDTIANETSCHANGRRPSSTSRASTEVAIHPSRSAWSSRNTRAAASR
jgi:hypothetical protein